MSQMSVVRGARGTGRGVGGGGRAAVARAVAETLLADLPERWSHTIAVAARAEELAGAVDPADRDALIVAAWLHDIGYGRLAVETGFHPLDGARYLDRHGWPARISALVAHHSGADFLAISYGRYEQLSAYPHENSPVSDALTYADQTTGPAGEPMAIGPRMTDAIHRHGPESPHALVHHVRGPYLLETATRVEQRLTAASTL
jgi:putative nucleotidyltransferase with HDIG domain